MSKQRAKQPSIQKREITLATLLAYQAIPESLRLLQKYGQPKAANPDDLEDKLNELYDATPDKLSLERELAEIHPHKDWLLKHLLPSAIEPAPQVMDVEAQKIVVEDPKDTVKSSADGLDNTNKPISDRMILTKTDYLGFIGVIGAIGLSYYIISMANKK